MIARSPILRWLLRWPACMLLGALPGAAWPAWAHEANYRFSPAAIGGAFAGLAALAWLAYLHAASKTTDRASMSYAVDRGQAELETGARCRRGHAVDVTARSLVGLAGRNAGFALAVFPLALASRMAIAVAPELTIEGSSDDGGIGTRVSIFELDPNVLAAIAIGLVLVILLTGFRWSSIAVREALPLALVSGLALLAPAGPWAAGIGGSETASAAWLIFWPFSAAGVIGTGPKAWGWIGGLCWAGWLELLVGSSGGARPARESGKTLVGATDDPRGVRSSRRDR